MPDENESMTNEKETKGIIKQVLDEDNPLSWRTRILIYAITVVIAMLAVLVGVIIVMFFPSGGWPLAQTLTLGLALFGFIISIGHLIVKTHDIKKQFKDNYTQRAQQRLTTAIGLLYNDKDSNARTAGVRLLSQLAQDKNYVDRDIIKTSFLVRANLSGTYLSNVDLSGFDLRKADLSNAILTGAGLPEANLREANLSEADLSEANLSEANLLRAILSDADLHRADLLRANLQGANLQGAFLRGAKLQEADLREANLLGAFLQGADLSEVKNLDTANLDAAGYDDMTKFPAGFEPEGHGMVEVS